MTASEALGADYLSYSRLRSYQACSLAFYFHYVARETPAFTPAALAFGSAFHRAAEDALVARMAGQDATLHELLPVFDASLDESEGQAPIWWGERGDRETSRDQGQRMLEAWLAWDRPTGRTLAVEHQFEVELAPWLPKLHGRVDLVEETEAELLLLDLKTSRAHWGPDEVEAGKDQLILYREGLRDLIESVGKPVRLGWEIVGKVKSPWVERIFLEDPPPTAARPVKIATVILEAIETRVFVPSPGWACATCPYRKACRAW